MSLLGNEVVEFFLRNQIIQIEISSLNHLLQNGIVSQFSEILGDLSEIFQGNKSSFLTVEGNEDFVDFISALVVGRTSGHHVNEFREFDLSATVLIEFSDHLINSLGFSFNTERIDGNFEF